jgi:hypothetical protein
MHLAQSLVRPLRRCTPALGAARGDAPPCGCPVPGYSFNEAAKYAYVICLLVATFLNLSAIVISTELYINTMKTPAEKALAFAPSTKGNIMYEVYMHAYCGAYSLWGAVCAGVYLQHGSPLFWISLAFGVAFVGFVGIFCTSVLWYKFKGNLSAQRTASITLSVAYPYRQHTAPHKYRTPQIPPTQQDRQYPSDC